MKGLSKIKKIVYPHYNGTAVWYKRNRYDVVLENGDKIFIYDWNVIRLLEFLIELEK